MRRHRNTVCNTSSWKF